MLLDLLSTYQSSNYVTRTVTVPWTPTNLTSVLLLGWYRIRDIRGAIAQGADVYNGTNVTLWKDRSGRGNDLPIITQSVSGHMVYAPNGFGTNFASVTTDGYSGGTGWFGAVNMPTGKLGCFSALKQSSAQTANGARIVSIGNVAGGGSGNQDYSSPNAIVLFDPGSDGTRIGSNYGQEYDATVLPNTPLIIGTYYRDAPNNIQGISLNGTEVGTLSRSYDNAPANLGLGTNGAYQGSYWAGDHAEHVLFSGTLSLGDQQNMEGYMAWNNNTQGALRSDHPNKTSMPMTTIQVPVYIRNRRRPSAVVAS